MNLRYIFLGFLLLIATLVSAQKREGRHKRSDVPVANVRGEASDLLIDAMGNKLIGNTLQAKDGLEQCLKKYPDYAPALYELARIYFDESDYVQAAALGSNAAKLEPQNKWYKLLLADIYGKTNSISDLLPVCKALADLEPDNPDFQLQLANAYLMDDDGSKAIKTYDRIEEIMGVTEEVSLQKERIYLLMNKPEKAQEELEKLAQANPDQKGRYHSMIAEMYMQLNQADKAARYYEMVAAESPDDPYIHISLSDYYRKRGLKDKAMDELKTGFENPTLDIDTKVRILLSYFQSPDVYEQYKDRLTELSEILVKVHPDDPKSYSLHGDFLSAMENYSQARDAYRKVISIDSSKFAIWQGLLNCELQLKDYHAVVEESYRAMDLFPMLPLPYYFGGVGLYLNKQYPESVAMLEKGLKLLSGNTEIQAQFYSALGDACNGAKQYAKSDDYYEKALKINDQNSYLLNNYAYYLSLRGENLDKALVLAEKAVKLEPQNPANIDTFGWVLYKKGDYQKAREYVEKAISLQKGPDADLIEHLGDIYFRLGNTQQAVEQWQKALNLNQGSDGLKQKIREKKLDE